MDTIKIISDPYKRNIAFRKYDEEAEAWMDIDEQNNPESKLIKNDIVKSFFPYKVKEIVERLNEEYITGDEILKILFEGTTDEYLELEEVCKGFENVELERSSIFIENARDILPRIVDIFLAVKPIVDKSIESKDRKLKIEQDIAKFTDASNDIVPICVLGNYSSGKSTFINALIGQEILPSGDMPVTAKIYRVAQSDDHSKAFVSFIFEDDDVSVEITEQDYTVQSQEGVSIANSIDERLGKYKDSSISVKVSKCLDVINKKKSGVSDLIDIVIPFRESLLSESKSTFVIFDTPGSNTATNKEHFEILEEAMKKHSNGIPIYVAEFNSLDSCDNEKLYGIIKDNSQIDERFTMIIVNKADMANIKEDHFDSDAEEMILDQAVPRNLYSGGIYFISSIMGLGSKNDGDFIDDHAAEFFEDNSKKYSDPDNKRYKQLYKYNIMPEQIKRRICSESEEAEDKIFANSGLLAIEQEIVNFAEKYSAYDKCNQSDKYINNIINYTQEEIDETKKIREEKKERLEGQLDKEKKMLIQSMEVKSQQLKKSYTEAYDQEMQECKSSEDYSVTKEDMEDWEYQVNRKQEKEHDYSKKVDDLIESGASIFSIDQEGQKTIGSIAKEIGDDIKETWGNLLNLRETRTETDIAVADEIVKEVSADYNDRLKRAAENIGKASKDYWEKKSQIVKQQLLQIVANSSSLDEEKKNDLSEIIIKYRNLSLKNEYEFHKESFEKKFIIINLNRLNLKKLADDYNSKYEEAVNKAYSIRKKSHRHSFAAWLEQLVDEIRTNIVSYSPKLSEQAQRINEEAEIIRELEETKNVLIGYREQIASLLSWESVE